MSKDKYDEAIEYLNEHPDEIKFAWDLEWNGKIHPAACLFMYAGPDCSCGCLTQIRGSTCGYRAVTPELTNRIRNDERLPDKLSLVTLEHLPLFAEYQREVDKITGPRDLEKIL